MIIFGTRAKLIATEAIPDACPNCNNRALELQVWQQYAHIFWIPAFPTKKFGASVCQHCKQLVESKNLSPAVASTYQAFRKQQKAPVWMYAAICFFAIMIIAGVFINAANNRQNIGLARDPRAGDVYEMKLAAREYTIFRVARVSADSVVMQLHNFSVNKATGFDDLREKGEAGFGEEFQGYSRPEILAKLESGEIYDIKRP